MLRRVIVDSEHLMFGNFEIVKQEYSRIHVGTLSFLRYSWIYRGNKLLQSYSSPNGDNLVTEKRNVIRAGFSVNSLDHKVWKSLPENILGAEHLGLFKIKMNKLSFASWFVFFSFLRLFILHFCSYYFYIFVFHFT
jgi:hypothetical protein